MGKDCATILTGFEELQKGEIEKRFGMQRLLPAIRSRDQLIIICTPTIFIIITIIFFHDISSEIYPFSLFHFCSCLNV